MRFSLAVVVLAAGCVLAEPELKPSGLKVEYLSKPDPCTKVARYPDYITVYMHYICICTGE
jgi:hypothetical protein